jgi:hypothetical protein
MILILGICGVRTRGSNFYSIRSIRIVPRGTKGNIGEKFGF